MPFNGTNPHSGHIGQLFHTSPEVVASIQDVGALVLFLPSYSPDLNLIEELFSKVKTTLNMPHITDLQILLLPSFNSVTLKDYNAWIEHEIYT